MNSVMAYVARSVGTFSAESRVVGVGRSLIALAQISVLVFTPAAYLFVPVGGEAISIDCRSLPQQASAYCLVDSSQRQLMTWVLLVLLLVVASGLLPRVTPLVHFWVSLSINSSISLPDGGEVVALEGLVDGTAIPLDRPRAIAATRCSISSAPRTRSPVDPTTPAPRSTPRSPRSAPRRWR